jgi:hypothetical protein
MVSRCLAIQLAIAGAERPYAKCEKAGKTIRRHVVEVPSPVSLVFDAE